MKRHQKIFKAIVYKKVFLPLITILVISWSLYFWINFYHDKSWYVFFAKILPFLFFANIFFIFDYRPILRIPIEEDTRTGILVLRSFLDIGLQTYKYNYTNYQDSGVSEGSGYFVDKKKLPMETITHQFHFLKDIEGCIWEYARVVLVNNATISSDFRYGSMNSVIVSCNDEIWRETVSKISVKAKAILITPSNTPGVLEEFKMIKENKLFFKTIIYMPKSDKDNRYNVKWNVLRKELKLHDIILPLYKEHGMLYIPKNNFEIEKEFLLNSLNQFLQSDSSFWKLLIYIMKNEIKSKDIQIKNIVSGSDATEGYNII